MRLGIVTTTFNRKNLLKRLYKSLEEQSNQNFTWIIIDDGSKDNSSEYINKLNPAFELRYFYKENAGKAKALNFAFNQNRDIDLYIVVDSDDYLLENAIEIIEEVANKYSNDDNIGALFFRYKYENNEILGENMNTYNETTTLSRIEHDARYDKIDGCICYYREPVQKYQYPEFKGENYVGPTVIQMKMSDEYKIAFHTEVIGVAEYQEDGLTNVGRKLRLQNPKSMLVYCHYMQDERFDLLTRVKYGIMANAYYQLLDKETLSRENINVRVPKVYKPIGIILSKYWKKKNA